MCFIFRVALFVRRVGAVVGFVGDVEDHLLVENVGRVGDVIGFEASAGREGEDDSWS